MKLHINPTDLGPDLVLLIPDAPSLSLSKGGEGSRGGNIIGHFPSGKPIYGSRTGTPDKLEHSEEHPHGTYHVENQGAYHGVYFKTPRERKPNNIGGSSTLEGAKARIAQHVEKQGKPAWKPEPGKQYSMSELANKSGVSLVLDVEKANPHRDPSRGSFIHGGAGRHKSKEGQHELSDLVLDLMTSKGDE